MRSPALPASTSCFAARHVHMIDIANLANGREAILMDPPNLARRHFYQGISRFQCSKRRLLPGTPRHLAAAAWSQFYVVNIRAQRNRAKRQRISQIRRNIIPGNNTGSDSKSTRRKNVAHFSIAIFNESNARGAIWVVLNPDHFRRYTVLAAFKIDFAIFVFVPATDMSRCKPPAVVASTALLLGLKKA